MHLSVNSGQVVCADMFLGHLAKYKMDHHIRGFMDLLPELIQEELSELPAYLGSR